MLRRRRPDQMALVRHFSLATTLLCGFFIVFGALSLAYYVGDMPQPYSTVRSYLFGRWFYSSNDSSTIFTNASNIEITADFDSYIPGVYNSRLDQPVHSSIEPVASALITDPTHSI